MVESKAQLGASEFAATLNGDDPYAILRVLRQFSKIVQKERRLALSIDDDKSDSSDDYDSSDEEKIEQRPAKKLKKDEQWKEDSASFHVPFVGTSVAKSDVANVIRGQWPTGLLEAYLNRSPLAVELTNDDLCAPDGQIHKSLIRKNQIKTSRAIQTAYLRTLTELVTAVIPLNKLRGEEYYLDGNVAMIDELSSSEKNKFFPVLLKKRFSDIFKLLSDETGRGRGKTGVVGGCGNMTVQALKLLQNIALVSVANARSVSRHLDEALNDGVLRCLLRPLPPRKENSTNNSDKVIVRKKDARVEAINLATILLKVKDSAVNTYICTSGSRERKVKPGILFFAFREGLTLKQQGNYSAETNDDYMEAVADMIATFRSVILNHPRTINQKLLFDLLSRDPLQNLSQLLSYAPPLADNNTFHDILNASDTYSEDLDSLPNAAVESRRLLLPLLSDSTRSPFLAAHGHGSLSSKSDGQQLVRTLIQLRNLPNGGIQIHHFLVDCVKTTPSLLSSFFRILTFPDSKQIFEFISTLHFVSSLIREGPSPMECLPSANERSKLEHMEDILVSILPVKFRRQALAKALQSKNALVVLECLKLLKVVIDRFNKLKTEGANQFHWSDDYKNKLSATFALWLPDLQVILTVRTRFNAYSGKKDCALINDNLNRVLEGFTIVLPSLVKGAKFDWLKLVPGSATKFFKALPLVQRSVLRTLKLIIGVSEIPNHSILHSCKYLLEIILTAKSRVVREESRQIVKKLLVPMMMSRWSDSACTTGIEYECSCWIDNLTIDSLPAFCKLLQHVSEQALTTIASIGEAWTACDRLGAIEFSLLIVASLNSIDTSSAFSLLASQVCLKSLLFHRSPLMLATLIRHFSEKCKVSGVKFCLESQFVEFANSLCRFDQSDETMRIDLLGKNLSSNLSSNDDSVLLYSWIMGKHSSSVVEALPNEIDFEATPEKLIAHVRFLMHLQVISNGTGVVAERSWKMLRRIVPKVLLSIDSEGERNMILRDIDLWKGNDKGFEILVASCPFTSNLRFARTKIEELGNSLSLKEKDDGSILLHKGHRASLLEFSVLGDTVPMNSIAQAQLALINNFDFGLKDPTKNSLDFIYKFIESTKSEVTTDVSFELDVIRQLFDEWWALSDQTTENSVVSDIRSHFSSILKMILEEGNSQSAMLIALIRDRQSEALLERCLSENGSPLLIPMLKCDLFRLIPCLLDIIDKDTENIWEDGLLDDGLLLFLGHSNSLCIKEEDCKILCRRVISRAESQFTEVLNKNRDLSDLQNVLQMIRELLETPRFATEVDISKKFLQNLSITVVTLEKNNPVSKSLCELVMTLLKRKDLYLNEDGSFVMAMRHLASIMFLQCLEWLPQTYKTKEVDAELLNVNTRLILQWLLSMLSDVEEYESEGLEAIQPMLTQKVIRSCLKYGLGLSDQSPEVSSMSLKLIRELITRLSDPRSPMNSLKEHLEVIPPFEIFNMLTSHSKFVVVLASSTEEADRVKVEIVHLMVFCMAKAPNDIKMDLAVWTALFGTFNAGLGELDTVIRKLFYACCDLLAESKDVHIPYLNEFRWRGCEDGPKGSHWDWFLDALDSNRIRATISHFPILDTVEINLGTTAADESDSDNDDEKECTNSDESSDSNSSEDEDMMDSESVDTLDDSPNGLSPGALWNPHGQDLRYSPAFLLPFILGALESTLPPSGLKDDAYFRFQKKNSAYQDKHLGTLALMVQKLCDRGVLSLCLASLASRCEKIRCYAVGILGILLRACSSAEAKTLSSWRGRPQVAMLLNSVQRAFVIKRVTSSSQGSPQVIPILSPLISTFLARSSLSISKPDDTMFVPLNRYFLKNERDHGAFPDMNRLPAFISFFCSSSDDPTQSRKERIWALQHVRDGFADSSCYRLVASCHAPELILTSFENQRLSRISIDMKDSEFTLMLNVFSKFINFGSNRVVSHLISRLGLLSWMRSWSTSWPLHESFPGIKSRIAFCELVGCAVKQASRDKRLRTDVLLQEVCGLVQPVALFGIDSNESEEGFSLLVDSICQALDSLRMVLLRLKEDYHMGFDVNSLGISIETSLNLLVIAKSHNLQEKASLSLSTLPVCLDGPGLDRVSDFCTLLLVSCLQSRSDKTVELQSSIIERVMLIANRVGATLATSPEAIESLLAIRSRFVVSEQQHELLNQCLKALATDQNCNTESRGYVVARELLK